MKATLRPSAATPPHTTNCDKQSQSGPDHALGKEHATLEKLLHLGCGSPQVWAQHGRCALNLSFVVKHGRGVTTFRMVDYRYEERCDECLVYVWYVTYIVRRKAGRLMGLSATTKRTSQQAHAFHVCICI